ncbi:hypothetical protein XPA_004521 [Xanthoria parietina]
MASGDALPWQRYTYAFGKQPRDEELDFRVTLINSLRPALHRLLGSLARLHRMGVCHNDVKPDNIYVEDELYWLLGDLGNVREIHHPYYSTPQWHREGQWVDCQANDVRRALISYLTLIRRASADTEAFDQQFLCSSSPLAQLYWDFMAEPTSANELLHRLEVGQWNASTESSGNCPCLQEKSIWPLRRPSNLQRVDSELRWSTVPSRWKFWTQ